MKVSRVEKIEQILGGPSNEKKLRLAQKAQGDLYYLCKYILGYSEMEKKTHEILCDYVKPMLDKVHAPRVILPIQVETEIKTTNRDQYDRLNNHSLFLLPRGSFKSSIITIGFTLQFLLNNPDARILIDSETFSKSKAFLAEIKGHLTGNSLYRAVFRTIHGILPDEGRRNLLWTDSQLNVAARRKERKEPTYSCAGIDVTKTGMHYDLIVMDDVVSEKNITTIAQMDQVIQHYRLSLSLLEPNAPLIIVGTRWHFKDLYQFILDNERDTFNIMIRGAYNPDGSLFFPERLDEKFLDKTKKSQGSYTFSCQYLNSPTDDENAVFKSQNFHRVSWDDVKDRPFNWYLVCDPSYEGPYSDYAAFVVAGKDHMDEIYVRHIVRAKMTYSDIVRTLFDLNDKFNPREILLETVATQKSIMHTLNDEQKRRGRWLRLTETKFRERSKEERVRGLAPYYEFGRIHHIKECPQLDDLELELIQFPVGEHDDIIDALADVLEVAIRPSNITDGERKMSHKAKIASLDKPRSPMTGV